MHLILLGILLLLLALIVYSLLTGDKRRSRSNGKAAFEPMVRCDKCGVHLPARRALGDARSGYRCPDHEHD